MTKILAVSGSPVSGASTDMLLDAMAKSVIEALGEDECRYRFVKLSELDYEPCRACGFAPDDGFCVVEDGLTGLYNQLAECDLLLFGSPVYFDSVSAQAKAFIDRCNCFRPADFDEQNPDHDFVKLLNRKRPGAMVLVGGEKGWFEGARRVVAGFFKWIEVVNEGGIQYRSKSFHYKGTASDDPGAMTEARELGRKLADALKSDKYV